MKTYLYSRPAPQDSQVMGTVLAELLQTASASIPVPCTGGVLRWGGRQPASTVPSALGSTVQPIRIIVVCAGGSTVLVREQHTHDSIRRQALTFLSLGKIGKSRANYNVLAEAI